MNKIAAAFVAAKKEFAPALKSSTNPHFRSKYADLAGCLEAVNDALLNNGIAVYQETSEDEIGITVETVFLHESGETLRGGKLHVPAAKQDPQGYGSALTYARRYSIMAACGIAAEDDDGNAASRPKSRNALDNVQSATPRLQPSASYPLSLPAKEEPHSVHQSSSEWADAFIAVMTSVEKNGKMETRLKMTKLRELREANEELLNSLEVAVKGRCTNDYQLRLKRLGAQLGDDNGHNGLDSAR